MKKWLKYTIEALCGLVVLGGSGVGAYLLIPTKKEIVKYDDGGQTSPTPNFDKFFEKISTEGIEGLDTNFNVNLTYENNPIDVSGNLKLQMENLEDITFESSMIVDINNLPYTVGLSYVDNVVFVSAMGINLKIEDQNLSDIFNDVIDLFSTLSLSDSIKEISYGLVHNEALSLDPSITDSIKIKEEVLENGYKFNFTISNFGEMKLNLDADLSINKNYDITGLLINNVDAENLKLKGKTSSCVNRDDLIIVSPEYSGEEFLCLDPTLALLNKLSMLLKTRQFGIHYGFALRESYDLIGTGSGDIFANLADVNDFEDIESILNSEFDISLDLYGNDGCKGKLASMMVNYFESNGYLNFNDIIKGKVTLQDIATFISKFIDTNLPVSKLGKVNNFSFNELIDHIVDTLLNSDLITALMEGHYEKILDYIDIIEMDDTTIKIGMALDELGLGGESYIVLNMINNNESYEPLFLSIELYNVELLNIGFDLNLVINDYSEILKLIAELDQDNYVSFSFVNNLYDQISELVDNPQFAFNIKGTVIDEFNDGFDFNGQSQMDLLSEIGYGNIDFNEYRNGGMLYDKHNVKIDATGNEDQILFAYRDKLKGKINISTVNELIELIALLINQGEEEVQFLNPLNELMFSSILEEVLATKNYFRLLKNDILKKCIFLDSGHTIELAINLNAFGLPVDNDLDLVIRLDIFNRLTSIEIVNLSFNGKLINASLELTKFDPASDKQHILSLDDGNYLNFSDISILLKCLIMTSQLNYYHLTASIDLKFGSISLAGIKIDCYIMVEEGKIRVVTYIKDIPLIPGVTVSGLNVLGKRNSLFVYETDEEGNSYLHFRRETDYNYLITTTKERYYWVCDEENFYTYTKEYLLINLLGLEKGVLNGVSPNNAFGGDVPIKYEDIINENGYKYDADLMKWTISLNMGVIMQNDEFGNFDFTITHDEDLFFTSVEGTLSLSLKLGLITTKGKVSIKANLIDVDPEEIAWPESIENVYQQVIYAHDKYMLNTLNGTKDNLTIALA